MRVGILSREPLRRAERGWGAFLRTLCQRGFTYTRAMLLEFAQRRLTKWIAQSAFPRPLFPRQHFTRPFLLMRGYMCMELNYFSRVPASLKRGKSHSHRLKRDRLLYNTRFVPKGTSAGVNRTA